MTPTLSLTLREFARTMVTDFSREEILDGLVNRIASEMPVSSAGENGFKAINDQYGHACGDALLIAVGERLTRAVRPADTVARWAGDEFAIVCEDLEAPAAVTSLVARIKAEFQRPFDLGDETVEVTTSIGVAFAAGSIGSPDMLLRDADQDMYRNKRLDNSRH